MKFAGRTDVGLVREFFRLNHIEPDAAHFQRFFASYVYWLDHILAQSQTETCPGIWELIRALQALPNPPTLGLLTGNIRLGAKSNCAISICGRNLTGAFADDHEDRDQIAHVAHTRGSRLLGKTCAGKKSSSSATPRWM